MTLEGWPDVARAATDVEPWVWPRRRKFKEVQSISHVPPPPAFQPFRRQDCLRGFLAYHHVLHHEYDRICAILRLDRKGLPWNTALMLCPNAHDEI